MRPFTCDRCGTTVYFENDRCETCGAALGFVPAERRIVSFDPPSESEPSTEAAAWPRAGGAGPALAPCANRAQDACNWMLDAGDARPLCRSCRLDGLIPDLSVPGHRERWGVFEQAKRRFLFTLLALGLPFEPKAGDDDPHGLQFRILAPTEGAPVTTGHAAGVITLNLDEADDLHREAARLSFGEPWRTVLGHVRHEAAHYLQYRWVLDDEEAAAECRAVFGDERADYAAALARYHAEGPQAGWQQQFISAYASAHPFEDWAETCAHFLLVVDAVETAGAWGLVLDSEAAQAEPAADQAHEAPVDALVIGQWLPVARFLNAMNRSLGLRDSYPFLMPDAVLKKMGVVSRLLRRAAARAAAADEARSGA